MTDPKKPGVAFWATVVVVTVLVGYPLSLGPACWISSYSDFGPQFIPTLYRPLVWTFGHAPEDFDDPPAIGKILQWYSLLAARRGWDWVCSTPDPERGPYTWEWGEFGSP